MYEQMSIPGIQTKAWEYDEDNGSVMCRCPDCGWRLMIGLYTYLNPYRYCPHCGTQLLEGKIMQKRLSVYRLSPEHEAEGRKITEEMRRKRCEN